MTFYSQGNIDEIFHTIGIDRVTRRDQKYYLHGHSWLFPHDGVCLNQGLAFSLCYRLRHGFGLDVVVDEIKAIICAMAGPNPGLKKKSA